MNGRAIRCGVGGCPKLFGDDARGLEEYVAHCDGFAPGNPHAVLARALKAAAPTFDGEPAETRDALRAVLREMFMLDVRWAEGFAAGVLHAAQEKAQRTLRARVTRLWRRLRASLSRQAEEAP